MHETRHTLIITNDPVEAALIGLAIEARGRVPLYPTASESAQGAVQRLSPGAVVLVAAGNEALRSDIFFRAVKRVGARAIAFGLPERIADLAAVAAAHPLGWLIMPPSTEALDHLSDPERRQPGTGDRRADPRATIATGGVSILVDSGGTRWLVYDRRSPHDRRRLTIGTVDRTFVCEDGRRVSRQIAAADAHDMSATTLQDQLSGHT